MGDLSEHFSRSEFACKCGCGQDTVDVELIEILETLREHIGQPIRIMSGNRCKKHNAEIGGAEKSLHIEGKAADFRIDRINPAAVAIAARELWPDKYGIGQYKDWTHIDSRKNKARWRK